VAKGRWGAAAAERVDEAWERDLLRRLEYSRATSPLIKQSIEERWRSKGAAAPAAPHDEL
jgi:hypothetical protein